MRWARSLCKLQVDFDSLCSAGTCVFFWSIPSMMIVTYFSGWFRDFSQSWYFALSSLLMQNLQFNLCFRLRKTFNLILDQYKEKHSFCNLLYKLKMFFVLSLKCSQLPKLQSFTLVLHTEITLAKLAMLKKYKNGTQMCSKGVYIAKCG